MSSTTLNENPKWLFRPLCRRYAFIHISGFHISELEEGVPRQRNWFWAFAMFAPDEFEILGAWPMDSAAVEQIVGNLRKRGVLSIRVISVEDVEGHPSPLSLQPWATELRDAEPRVLGVVRAQSIAGISVEGVPSAAIQSALNAARQIHGGLVRRSRCRPPFASAAAAAGFIASWLQTADRRLHEVRQPKRHVVAYTA